MYIGVDTGGTKCADNGNEDAIEVYKVCESREKSIQWYIKQNKNNRKGGMCK